MAAQLGATDALQAAFSRAWEQAQALARLKDDCCLLEMVDLRARRR